MHDGVPRSYHIHVPSGYDEAAPVPLVLALHGGRGTGSRLERLTGLTPIAEEEGFIVVYPNGINQQWNDGVGLRVSGYPPATADDTGFLLALIEALSQEYAIDPGAVFVTGASNGGTMAFVLACEAPSVIAGIAPVMTSLATVLEATCTHGPPVPLLMIHGTKDSFVPYEGGAVLNRPKLFGEVLGVEATLAIWASRNGCMGGPTVTPLPGGPDGEDARVFVETFDCADAPMVLYRVEGGGHTWPGGSRFQLPWLLGPVNRDFDASRVIWEFFEANRR